MTDNRKYKSIKLEDSIQRIQDVIEDVVPLYRDIQEMIFSPIDSNAILYAVPFWIADAGRSSESAISSTMFGKFIRVVDEKKDSTLNKVLYWYDVEAWLNAIQDRLDSVIWMLREFYMALPSDEQNQTTEEQINRAIVANGEVSRRCYFAANTIFINLASVFDIISKVACELEKYPGRNFNDKYPDVRLDWVKFKTSLPVSIKLKQPGMLFAEPEQPIARIIETLRNEYVHNGPWDRSPSIYHPIDANGNPQPSFMLMPDLMEIGAFPKVRNRNKFYAQKRRLNEELITIVDETIEVIRNTIQGIRDITKAQTAKGEDKQGTNDAVILLREIGEEVSEIMRKENLKAVNEKVNESKTKHI